MNRYERFVSPALDHLDSERAHVAARELLHFFENDFTIGIIERLADQGHHFMDERLNVVVGGVSFENPLIVGAGWDKAGRAVRGLYELGFAGVEVGSVLAYPQPGNPKPRQWMIGPGVALNRLGFNSPGMEQVAKNLENYRDEGIPIGISIGVNKHILEKGPDAVFEAQAAVVDCLVGYADYIVNNPASPNTPGLRAYQAKDLLIGSTIAIGEAIRRNGGNQKQIVKLAPDLANNELDDAIGVAVDYGLGIVAVNTTNSSDIKAKYGERWQDEMGGLSGDDEEFRAMATEKVRHIREATRGAIEIIGVGGVNSGPTALEKIAAGANAIQIVTGIRQVGPTLPGQINRWLVDYMEREGIHSIADLVGSAVADHTQI